MSLYQNIDYVKLHGKVSLSYSRKSFADGGAAHPVVKFPKIWLS